MENEIHVNGLTERERKEIILIVDDVGRNLDHVIVKDLNRDQLVFYLEHVLKKVTWIGHVAKGGDRV